jgi:uncharacterized protein
MNFLRVIFGLCVTSSVCFAQGVTFPRTELTLGMYRIDAEVAHTPQTRERGLMFREQLGQNQGMVFVFPNVAQHCMWMKNTPLPLSVAFLDEQGRVLNVEEMAPRTEVNHCASKEARYALEMNSRWFFQRGFAKGAQIKGLERFSESR